MLKAVIMISALSFSLQAFAIEAEPGFKGESELGITQSSGNTETDNITAKSENKYLVGDELWTLHGRYLRTTDQTRETARSWEAGLRYEKVFSKLFSGFVGHRAESDPFAGYVQRNSSDLGLKYTLTKTDSFYWIAEGGYRYTVTHNLNSNIYESFARLYTEARQELGRGNYAKLWVEHLPNFTNSKRYLTNAEASVGSTISEILSMKVSYLVKAQNEPPAGLKKVDSIFMTTLVAKY